MPARHTAVVIDNAGEIVNVGFLGALQKRRLLVTPFAHIEAREREVYLGSNLLSPSRGAIESL